MILKEIHLHPFGGLTDTRVEFVPGLNIILGPNEAGKSTLVNAIYAILFFPSNLRKNSTDWKDYLAGFMPHPHGDTMKVSLRLSSPRGEEYVLTRCWGEERMDNLTLPQGNVVNSEKKIREIFDPLLKYGRGTYAGVFLARQEEMLNTLEILRKDGETPSTLTDILRTVVLESGGVSVEKVKKKVEEEKKQLLSLWDLSRDGPKDGRGLDNPFKKGLGKILSTYYEVERLKRKIEESQFIESRIAEKRSQIQEVLRETELEENKVREMEKNEKDIYDRSTVEPRLKLLQKEEEDLKEIMEKWPLEEGKLSELSRWLEEKEGEKQKLETEYHEAQQVVEHRKIRELHGQVKPLIEHLKSKQKEMQELPAVSPEDISSMEKIKQRIHKLQSALEAMRLKAEINVENPERLKITSGLKDAEEVHVEGELSVEAEGKLIVQGVNWLLQVQSAQYNVEEIMEEINYRNKILKDKLGKYSLTTFEEAKEKADKRKELAAEVQQLQERIKDRLGSMSFEKLEEQAAALPPDKQIRNPEEVKESLDRVKMDISDKKKDINLRKEQIQKWKGKYTSTKEVISKLTEIREEIAKKQDKLNQLAPLPPGYSTPEEFMQELRSSRQKSKDFRGRLYSLEKELVELQNKQYEESSEELQESLNSAEKELNRLKSRGRAACLIEEEINNIIQEIDRQSFVPLADSFIKYFQPLSNYRYEHVNMEGPLPKSVSSSENDLPVNLLSIGTRRGLSLALRLAMADYLWGEEGGMLVMDDPLVDLDPQRRKNAAEILRNYSSCRQLLVFTCDPDVAELLGGKVIQL